MHLGATLASLLVAVAVALALSAPDAGAVILPATTIDGPSEDIAGFGGVAMAEDGTGGAVYLKRVEGVIHVFASRYVGGHWLPPARVDGEEAFAASSPRIGAAEDGELMVVWATPFATDPSTGRPVYELLGALLGPGSEHFGPAVIVDGNIGEAIGVSPDLAVSSTGQADVVYRVVSRSNVGVALLRPSDVNEAVRVARFDGLRWSVLGAVNRDAAIGMRPPSASNVPRIAIGPTGNGVVVWQEPDIEGVARIWGRRVFGSSLNYVMPASATTYNGAPIGDDADAPAVAFSRLGLAELAYRQAAGPASPMPGPRIFLNILPDGESTSGSQFQGATIADTAVAGGKAASVGAPSIDVDEKQDLRLVYDSNGAPRVIEGNDLGLSGALTLGSSFAGSEPAASVMNPQGGGVSAWPSVDPRGNPAVAVREDFPEGSVQTAIVAGGAGGEVGELDVGRSGLGDGLVGFRQGPIGDAAIVVAQATAPPAPFVLTAPKGWVRPGQASLSWQPAPSAAGPLTYHVVLDGRIEATPPGVRQARVDPRGLSSGRHRLQVLATDRNGQSTLSAPAPLLVDGVAPTVRISRTHGGSAVSIRVLDRYSGVNARAVSVSFGDGSHARGRARVSHRYRQAGNYLVIVQVRAKIGNQATVRQWVSVR